ncbi:MAG: hypothetical protein ACREUG_14820, partial [Steroidobacteraceae bacterium]
MRQRRTAVVVAHPDDEALWLSSAVAGADRVVFCFGAIFGQAAKSAARRQAVAALPLPCIVDLAIPESGSGYTIDPDFEPTPTGIELRDAAARARYDANFPRLTDGLRSALAGLEEIHTHNPWGEYGHPEHIQVHRAVCALQAELGYSMWYSNYVSAVSWPLARRLGSQARWAQRRIVPSDRAIAHRLMRVYRDHGAWTWNRGHRWPARETLFAEPPGSIPGSRRPIAGERLLDVQRLQWWSPSWRLARRRLPAMGQRPRRDGDVH